MLMPIAFVRPMRSPRLPSRMPPTAAPSMRAAVNHANQSPPRVEVKSAPSRLFEIDSDATGISPSSTPSNSNARNEAASTQRRCLGESIMEALMIASS